MIYARCNLIDGLLAKLIKFFGCFFLASSVTLSGCAVNKPAKPAQNLGDQIASRLHLGMNQKEIDDAIGDLKKYVISEHKMTIKTENDILRRYHANYFPRTFVKTLEVGTTYKMLMYWTHYAGRNVGTLELYFDANTQQLRGWVNTVSDRYRDKFLHEQLTSRLGLSLSYRVRLTKKQVYALIGLPTRVIEAPQKETRELYDDHFWQLDSASAPILENTPRLEVYEYDLGNGVKRKVFVGYTRVNDRLIFFGYDHAWEEAERYTREAAAQKF